MKKYQIGYTTGVFDLFHIGHLNILRKSKELCDFLIVEVTSDEQTMKKKNRMPIIPYNERIQIIESIRYVDKVVTTLLSSGDVGSALQIKAWKKYKYNALFKGDDSKGTDVYNKLEVYLKARGVDVVYFPYTKGTSSSKLSLYLEKTLVDNQFSRTHD